MSSLNGVTVVTHIQPEKVESVREQLRQLEEALENEDTLFEKSLTTHFARWVILDRTDHDELGHFAPTLIFASNFDGPVDEYLLSLIDLDFEWLNELYGKCEGVPTGGFPNSAGLYDYLIRFQVDINCYYRAHFGRTAQIIRKEALLREELEKYIDEKKEEWGRQSASLVRQDIQNYVRNNPELHWAVIEPVWEKSPWWYRATPWVLAALIVFFILSLNLFVTSVLAFGVFLWYLRKSECAEQQHSTQVDPGLFSALVDKEDHIVQNQMTSVTYIKPTLFRRYLLRFVLFSINFLAVTVFRDGRLGLITTIHFARWIIIDDDRRLVFFSNFDGSWENYLGDFIDRASEGLTSIWTNTIGFPDTKFLIWGGSRDELRFKNYARNSQVVTDFWYSAYRDLSCENVINNSQIRAGLVGELSEQEAQEWLRRF